MMNMGGFLFSVAGIEWILMRNVMTLHVTLCTDRHLHDVLKLNFFTVTKVTC